MALGGSCCPCENLVTLLPSEVTPQGGDVVEGGLGQGSKVWKVTDGNRNLSDEGSQDRTLLGASLG